MKSAEAKQEIRASLFAAREWAAKYDAHGSPHAMALFAAIELGSALAEGLIAMVEAQERHTEGAMTYWLADDFAEGEGIGMDEEQADESD